MDNGGIRNFVNTILRKEKEGSAITPARFNNFLVESMWEKINNDYSDFELSQIVTDTLASLKVIATIAVDGSGQYALSGLVSPNEYLHPTTLYYTYNGKTRLIDVVTDAEWTEYLSNTVLLPTDEYPIVKVANGVLYFNPIVSENVEFTYLRKPLDPYYDYYIDANDKQVYIAATGFSYTLQADETYTLKSFPYTVYSVGNTLSSSGGADATTISEELPFPEHERLDVAYKILQKFGVSIKENLAVQFGAQRELKEETT